MLYYYPTLSNPDSETITVPNLSVPTTLDVIWTFLPPANLESTFAGVVDLPPLSLRVIYTNPTDIRLLVRIQNDELSIKTSTAGTVLGLSVSNQATSLINTHNGVFEIAVRLREGIIGVYRIRLTVTINPITGIQSLNISIVTIFPDRSPPNPNELLMLTRIQIPATVPLLI